MRERRLEGAGCQVQARKSGAVLSAKTRRRDKRGSPSHGTALLSLFRILAAMSAERGCGSADIMAGGVGGGGEGVPWPTGADGYKLDKIIGKGAFATVWKAFCATRGVHVAVKVMDLENVTHSFEDIRQEVGALELIAEFHLRLCRGFPTVRPTWVCPRAHTSWAICFSVFLVGFIPAPAHCVASTPKP